jgi:ABC-type multidrug transport system fused ATPase/permease subunit
MLKTEPPPPRDCEASAERPPGVVLTPRSLFAVYHWRILATYALTAVENLLRLAQPLVLGWAINDLLTGQTFGLIVLVIQHLSHLIVGLTRQVYDTRAFTAIYSDLVTRMIRQQRDLGVDVSRVSARAALSREFVDFFERSVPTAIRAAFSIIGSLIMLAWYDPIVVVICLGLMLPAALVNRVYARWTRRLSRGLHDQLEREVDVIDAARPEDLRAHFDEIASWRVRLSNAEAINFGLMELFILGVIVLVLVRTCQLPDILAGDLFAVFRYLMLMLIGFDQIPRLVHQISRLQDVKDRMKTRG